MVKHIILLVVISFVLGSCGSDSSDCTAETVAGTYVGASICSDESLEGPTSLTVSGSGNQITLVDQVGDEFSVSLDGCNFKIPEISIEFFGVEIKTSGEGEFDGTTLTMTVETEAAGEKGSCVFTGIMQ